MNDEDKINAFDLCEDAKKANNLGADLGLGKGEKHEGAGKAMADTLYWAGAISQETRNTIKDGINTRNSIQHDEKTPKVTHAQVSAVNQAVNEVKNKLDNGFITEF